MQGSFMRLAANQGAGSSLSRSYNFRAKSKSSVEVRNVLTISSISASSMCGGRWDVAGRLNTVIRAGRQLL